tara:strand:- start:1008 stop:1130 length:123 start_codon:yes stop_codon:yes gene_type:complete
MSKGKSIKKNSGKTAPLKTLKEKRAAKAEKKNGKKSFIES